MKIEPRSASDLFLLGDQPCKFSVGDFWRWGVSDLLVNTTRGAVAEFIVGQALGCAGRVRDGWGPFDLRTADGTKIEVKSASYRQAWFTPKPSRIAFNIALTTAWDAETGKMVGGPKRHADIYVFCLLENDPPRPADPLDIARWRFFVLSTSKLNRACSNQKTIGLATLHNLGAIDCDFAGLPAAVRSAAGHPADSSLPVKPR